VRKFLKPLLIVLAASLPAFAAETPDFFDQQVKPLLDAKCMACHSPQAQSGGLVFTGREALLTGGNRGPAVVPGDPGASILIQAVRQQGDLKMPPGGALTQAEQDVLAKWVQEGAPWGAAAAGESKPVHWSFQPVAHPDPPQAVWPDKARNPIDQFVQAKLQKANLTPSPEADRATLIRRLSLDITGLPPTPEEVRAFVEDQRPDAYEQLVDKLLASPHYGERWGRHWLDIAHYADSNGYNIDGPRQMWMYRDWVIDALNRDLPYDQFVIEQIAGDLLPKPTKEQLIATGFHRNTLINLEGGIDFEQYRVEAVVDRVDTVGAAFLGLTLGCARCHTHKYDPITQKEFYQIYAFYDSIDELSGADGEEGRNDAFKPMLEFGSPEELQKRDIIQMQVALLQKDLTDYEKDLDGKQAAWEASLKEEAREKLTDEIRYVLTVPAKDRNSIQKDALGRVYHAQDLGWSERQGSINALRKRLPDLDTTMIMRERPEPRATYIHLGGDFLRKGVTVEPGTLAALPPLNAAGDRATRLDFAKWLVSDQNPLTPRVTVNRVWQRYFGLGIVETENDFGTQGAPPSHPELLDWLASWYRDNGWKTKELHRLIVTSHAYRQESNHRDDATEADPRNKLLSRQNRLRLEAEGVRDAALAASGLLNPEIGGKSVFPPQPEGASKLGQIQREWEAATDDQRFRRGMYTYFWRASPHPGLMVFDAPDSTNACTRRPRSNTPLQALTLLNDQAYYEFAQGMAKRVLDAGGDSNADRLDYAFQLCVAREPAAEERDELAEFLTQQLDQLQTNADDAKAIAASPELAAWTALSRVLLNLDEFITRE
jgi:hypothetical protein